MYQFIPPNYLMNLDSHGLCNQFILQELRADMYMRQRAGENFFDSMLPPECRQTYRMEGEWEAVINEAMEDEGTAEITRQSQADVPMTEAAQQTPKTAAKQPFTTANTKEPMQGEAEPPHVAGPK
ncbi:hypothetical protein CYMTET_50969 [Cymbomonas tetramitiformis]|uniref:Uncharacterized protein n=1 Tax=Cymbomonas tetramitiformis TaxID=36881 RepID=A0AAE0ET60_9CHLO|nr:hypothetical protein CYMTET_50969 [Cymbomonas tetramitiformis]